MKRVAGRMRIITIAACLAASSIVHGIGESALLPQLRLFLRPPSTQKLAVLPFWCFSGDQRPSDIATAAAYLIFQREGYEMLPLWEVEKVFLADNELERGSPIRKQDALRIGDALGADLVCYGEVRELETYLKKSLLTTRKKTKIGLKVSVVGCGEYLIVGQAEEAIGGQGFREATALERRAVRILLERLLKPICLALPAHKHNPEKEITGEDILKLEKLWEEKRRQPSASPSLDTFLERGYVPAEQGK